MKNKYLILDNVKYQMVYIPNCYRTSCYHCDLEFIKYCFINTQCEDKSGIVYKKVSKLRKEKLKKINK